MKIYQGAVLSTNPVNAMEAATKEYVDNRIASAGGGGIFITDVTPQNTGIVGLRQYVPNTVPANAVLQSAVTDTSAVRVTFVVEGTSAFYSPSVTVDGVAATLTEHATDKRFFTGTVNVTVTETKTVVAVTDSGNSASVLITKSGAAPITQSVTIGALPNGQTAVKSGDVVPVTAIVENSAVAAEVIAGGAAGSVSSLTLGAADSGGVGFKLVSGTFTVGTGTGAQKVSVRAQNLLGTWGAATQSTNQITLDQTVPTFGTVTITYPSSQTALKSSEQATVACSVTGADVYAYNATGEISLDGDPSTYAVSRTVSAKVGAGYTYNTNNYSIVATRTSNGAVATKNIAVNVSGVAATGAITITGSPSRLITSPTGQSYTVVVTTSQNIGVAPTLVASSGVWSGSWSGSGTTWSRTLIVTDGNPVGPQTFSGLVLTNRAGIVGNTITSGSNYTVGGFTRRTLTVPAFSQIVPIGATVVTNTKTNAKYSGAGLNLTYQPNTSNVAQGYTIVDAQGNFVATGGTHLWLNDAAFAGSNTSGTLKVEIEETV